MTLPLAASLSEELAPGAILAAFLVLSAGLWTWICARGRRGRPAIPLARRRPVPWQAQDVLFVFLMGAILSFGAAAAVQAWMGPDAIRQAAGKEPELAHPAEQLLRSGNPGMIVIAAVMAVVVAPLVEEFFYRVLLQGWLEAIWSRERRRRSLFRAAPVSWVPIVLPAAIFALRHVRFRSTPLPSRYLAGQFVGQMAANVLSLGLAIGLLRLAAGGTAADLGWKPGKLRSDAQWGLLALLAIVGPVLAIQNALAPLAKSMEIEFALDPIPLFPLALVMGWLYHRTHRIAPSLVLHMAFNATSVALFFAGS